MDPPIRLGRLESADLSDPALSRIQELLAVFYDLRASEEPDHDPEALLRFRKAVAAAALRPNERILDLGAKRGGLSSAIAASGSDVRYTGFDLSEVNTDAGADAGLTFVRGNVDEALPFDDGAFDCIFCLELLEHLTTPLKLLVEMRRVLTDTGRAVVSVPSPYSWVEVARELFGRRDTEGHLNSFPTPIMQNLAGLSRFSIVSRLGTSVRMPRTSRLVPTDSILARSRIYVLRPSEDVVLAGRRLS